MFKKNMEVVFIIKHYVYLCMILYAYSSFPVELIM